MSWSILCGGSALEKQRHSKRRGRCEKRVPDEDEPTEGIDHAATDEDEPADEDPVGDKEFAELGMVKKAHLYYEPMLLYSNDDISTFFFYSAQQQATLGTSHGRLICRGMAGKEVLLYRDSIVDFYLRGEEKPSILRAGYFELSMAEDEAKTIIKIDVVYLRDTADAKFDSASTRTSGTVVLTNGAPKPLEIEHSVYSRSTDEVQLEDGQSKELRYLDANKHNVLFTVVCKQSCMRASLAIKYDDKKK